MTRPYRRIATSLLASVTAAALTAAPRATSTGTPATAPSHLYRELAAVVEGGATSVLAVVQNHGHRSGGSAGRQQLGRPTPVDAFGRFRAGSVTKSFLATVVLQLVETGRIGLDTPIDRYLTSIPDGNRITVRMLLDHTSGLYNLTDTLPLNPPSGFLAIRWRQWTPAELLSRAVAQPSLFAPGTGYAYSDTNYIVLGLLVQRVTGHDPRIEIQRRIITPLHLQDSTELATPDVPGRHAHGYLPMPDGSLVDITRFNTSVLAYAGDLVSSGADLNRFFLALAEGRLLSPRTTRLMTTVTPPARNYGLGVEKLSLSCGLTAIGHDGDVPGYSTWAFTVPRTGRAIAVSMTWGAERPKSQALHLVDDVLCGRIDTPR